MKKYYVYLFILAVVLFCIAVLYKKREPSQDHICYLELHGVTQENQIFYTKFPMKHYITLHTGQALHLESESDNILSKWVRGSPSRGKVAIEYQGIWYCCINADIVNEQDYIRPYSSGKQPKLTVLYNDDFMHIPVFYSSAE